MKCPFGRLSCEDCRLFRRGVRLVGIEQKTEEIAACVFHIIADNLEELHRKVFTLQAEVGQAKQITLFDVLCRQFPDAVKPREELMRLSKRMLEE
jgi:hypothetical protein